MSNGENPLEVAPENIFVYTNLNLQYDIGDIAYIH